MAEVILARFSKFKNELKKYENEYEKLNTKIVNYDYEDSVEEENLISKRQDILIELKRVQSNLIGMFEFVELKTDSKVSAYRSILDDLNNNLPNRIEKHNKRVDELNKGTKNGNGFDEWKVR